MLKVILKDVLQKQKGKNVESEFPSRCCSLRQSKTMPPLETNHKFSSFEPFYINSIIYCSFIYCFNFDTID